MYRSLLLASALIVSISVNAQSVAEKKARTEADAAVKAAFAKVKGCKLSGSFDWAHLDKQKFSEPKQKDECINNASVFSDRVADALTEICADKDYVEAMKSMSMVILRFSVGTKELEAKKDGKRIVLDDIPGYVRFKESYEEKLKALF